MKRNWIELEGELWVPFDYKDPTPGGSNLGRAEFMVCIKHHGSHDFEYWVDPIQTHLTERWHYWRVDYPDFCISAYQKLDTPMVWNFSWCEEHQTGSFFVYAPDNAKYLQISHQGISFWRSNFGK